MPRPLPLYFQTKPPPEIVDSIARLAVMHGIRSDYRSQLYHSTVQPLGDARDFTPSRIEDIKAALTDLLLEPFDIRFDRIERSELRGNGMAAFKRRQAAIVRALSHLGLALPRYTLRPHLSLAYGDPANRRIAVPPISWTARELLLVMSIHGEGRHEQIASWPLIPRQGMLEF